MATQTPAGLEAVYICHFIGPLNVRRLRQIFGKATVKDGRVAARYPYWLEVLTAYGYTEEELRQIQDRTVGRLHAATHS